MRIISHTPKPSLNKSIKISKRSNQTRATPSPESNDLRIMSITPNPIMFMRKLKKNRDFPKLKNIGGKIPIFKPFQLLYK